MDLKFWQGKNVLVTGYLGLVGSNLVRYLLQLGCSIIGLDKRVWTEKTLLDEGDIRKITPVCGDVLDFKLIGQILKDFKIDVVFHLAAETLVGNCFRNPLKTLEVNIKGTYNTLEASRRYGKLNCIIVASSDKAYGTKNILPYREDASLEGKFPYDVSKSCWDLIAQMYGKTYNLPVGITRCGNIYGQGDFNFSRIVPDTITSALNQRELIIRSDGTYTRDYNYVNDIVDGYILLAETIQKKKLFGEAFNLSNNNPISVINLIKQIYGIAGQKPKYRILNEVECEIKHQYLSSVKAFKTLGWVSKYSIEEGLKRTINWYRAIKSG